MAIVREMPLLNVSKIDVSNKVYANIDLDNAGERMVIGAGEVVAYVQRRPGKTTDNEDCAGVFSLGNNDCALVVADGMGGAPCGADASRIVVESLQKAFDVAKASEFGYRESMLNGIDEAHSGIAALGVGAGSTLAAVEIFDNVLRPYHVGDSMIMVIGQKGKIKLQTIMHSPVGYAVESGLLDEDEALHHDDRHLISNYLGHPEMRIEIGPPLSLSRYDTVLIASDGLFDNLQVNEIVQLIRKDPLVKVSERLVDLCSARMLNKDPMYPSKPDDISFILFRRKQ